MTNPNDSAHPWKGLGPGLSKREYFAAMAMQGYRSNSLIHHVSNDFLAIWAVEATDSLLAELSKEKHP